jgi:gamma-glutamyl:cysteine ligase YbdK (ATP-grasp superfamily)
MTQTDNSKKARIWYDSGTRLWCIRVPGFRTLPSANPYQIFESWKEFLHWANQPA